MNKFNVIFVLSVVTSAFAEPPSGYSYKKIASFGGGSFGGGSFGGISSSYGAPSISSSYAAPSISSSYGAPSISSSYAAPSISSSYGAPSIGSGHFGGGGGYTRVSPGYQTSEGLHVDPELLHKIKEILLEQENLHGGGHGGYSSGGISSAYGPPSISSSYGPPSSSYGPPSHLSSRVVGIHLGGVQPGHQVAQFHQQSYAPSHSYSAPSHSYGVPSISSSYGAPSISSSYGVPH